MYIIYPAIIHNEDNSYWAEFPDLSGCHTYGDTVYEVMANAEEALNGYCMTVIESGLTLPNPSNISELTLADNASFSTLVSCDLKGDKLKSVKKTLTIPQWLNEAALEENINFSQVLQDALMIKLHMK